MKLYQRISYWALPWRIVIFFAILLVLWAPLALLFYGLGYLLGNQHIFSTFALISLYGCFIGHAWCWGRWVHRWSYPFITYGLVWRTRCIQDALIALVFGCGLVCLLFTTQVLLGLSAFYPKPILTIAVEGLAIGVGVSVAEELLFRGWLLTELQTSLSQTSAIIWSSVIFSLTHFIKPLSEVLKTSPQFFGLLLLGLILAGGRYISRCEPSFASLGLPIGLHGGLVWGYYIVDVGDLVLPSGHAPEWVTGIHGNPLSGALGVAILGFLTGLVWLRLRLE
ncbi:MAG: CPBP family intramembrane glutamic endopeptidase [Cyanobacteria bacterium P01_F01_bin.13]